MSANILQTLKVSSYRSRLKEHGLLPFARYELESYPKQLEKVISDVVAESATLVDCGVP